MTMADRIVVMNAGNIEQIGRPLDLYDNPQSIFVAEFIGSPSMNLLKGTFETADGAPVFRLGENGTLPLPAGINQPARTAGIYGIRPEYLSISEPGKGIAAKVIVVEPLGPEIQLTMSVGEQTLVAVFRERINVQPDDTLWLMPQADRACLFGTDGKRING
jgi:multiple sugar transport system ATP-binding protein